MSIMITADTSLYWPEQGPLIWTIIDNYLLEAWSSTAIVSYQYVVWEGHGDNICQVEVFVPTTAVLTYQGYRGRFLSRLQWVERYISLTVSIVTCGILVSSSHHQYLSHLHKWHPCIRMMQWKQLLCTMMQHSIVLTF